MEIQQTYTNYVKESFNLTLTNFALSASYSIWSEIFSYNLTYNAMKNAMQDAAQLRLPGLHYTPKQFFWIAAAQKFCTINRDQIVYQKAVSSKYPVETFKIDKVIKSNKYLLKDFGCFEP
jgi:hypothetical protein